MEQLDDTPRFRALYKAIGKMTSPGHWAAVSPLGFDVEPEDCPATAAVAVQATAAVRLRPAVMHGEPTAWVVADSAKSSAELRAERLARIRAERELAGERARIVQTVSRIRVAEIERSAAFRDQLRWSGGSARVG